MAQRTYKDIEAEANKKFGKGASKEKFEWRRQQQEAAGLEQESKKRGGVAGAYDRNKALVQAAIPTLAGLLVPGAGLAAGAIAGGLARGVDRPGKGGIGLDLGQAAKGALTGAGMGQLGAGLRTAAGNMLTQRAAEQTARAAEAARGTEAFIRGSAGAPPSLTPPGAGAAAVPPAPAPMAAAAPVRAGGMTVAPPRPPAAVTPPMGGGMPTPTPMAGMRGAAAQAAAPAAGGAAGGATGGGGLMSRILTGAQRNAPIIQAGLGAVSDVMGQQAQRAVQEQQLAQQQQQFQQTFNVSEEERRRLREQQNRLAALFMPRSA